MGPKARHHRLSALASYKVMPVDNDKHKLVISELVCHDQRSF
jgi:hypothetical protein